MMKKYHIADVLTLIRFICVGILIYLTVVSAHPGFALGVFIIGELTDAFDGICARAWPYPNDGKKRWWRKHAVVLDQVADVLLGAALVVYVMFVMNFWFAFITIMVAIVIAIPIQIWRNLSFCQHPNYYKKREKIVLVRRFLYLGTLFVYLQFMIWSLEIHFWFRVLLTSISVLCVLLLIAVKKDRLSEDKTT